MKKVQPGEVQGRWILLRRIVRPSRLRNAGSKSIFPKIKTLQVFDLDKHGEQLDKFLMIGFGTSGTGTCKGLRRERARLRTM